MVLLLELRGERGQRGPEVAVPQLGRAQLLDDRRQLALGAQPQALRFLQVAAGRSARLTR
jgi:hypothetical protein